MNKQEELEERLFTVIFTNLDDGGQINAPYKLATSIPELRAEIINLLADIRCGWQGVISSGRGFEPIKMIKGWLPPHSKGGK